MENNLVQISEQLTDAIDNALVKFKNISEEEWNKKPAGKWSKKEILGHLTDSAANNHIRFIKAQLAEKEFRGLGYEQDFFVDAQQYQQRNIKDVIELWRAYNMHLAHVIKHINPGKLNVTCLIGNDESVTFLFVVSDYVRHLKHHLGQILG
jgi:hypothetical protein